MYNFWKFQNQAVGHW